MNEIVQKVSLSQTSGSAMFQQTRASHLLLTHPSGKRHLPPPRGPYSVGFADVMTEGNPKNGTFFRLYYPTNERCMDEHTRWPLWMFEDKYISGTLTFLKAVAYRWPSWAPHSEYLLQDTKNLFIKNQPRFGFKPVFKRLIGNVFVPIIENASIKTNEQNQKWPLVVFSHGIGCCRFMYSQVCYDMASYGFIVVATEHRDGSGCMSCFYESSGNARNSSIKWINHQRCRKDENEYAFRNTQVHHRANEVSRALDVMLDLNEGKEIHNIFRKQTDPSFSELTECFVNLSQFKDVMDITRPVIAGHSFGGATTVLALIKDERFKVGVVLDAWLFPLRDENISVKEETPILFINTESFLNYKNLIKMSTLERQTRELTEIVGERKFLFIKGSVHQNQLDLPFVLPNKRLKKLLGSYSKTCPEQVMNINNKLIVQFLYNKLGMSLSPALNEEVAKYSHLLHDGLGLSDKTPTTE